MREKLHLNTSKEIFNLRVIQSQINYELTIKKKKKD